MEKRSSRRGPFPSRFSAFLLCSSTSDCRPLLVFRTHSLMSVDLVCAVLHPATSQRTNDPTKPWLDGHKTPPEAVNGRNSSGFDSKVIWKMSEEDRDGQSRIRFSTAKKHFEKSSPCFPWHRRMSVPGISRNSISAVYPWDHPKIPFDAQEISLRWRHGGWRAHIRAT